MITFLYKINNAVKLFETFLFLNINSSNSQKVTYFVNHRKIYIKVIRSQIRNFTIRDNVQLRALIFPTSITSLNPLNLEFH